MKTLDKNTACFLTIRCANTVIFARRLLYFGCRFEIITLSVSGGISYDVA